MHLRLSERICEGFPGYENGMVYRVEEIVYLRKCAHARVSAYIALCSHVYVILFIYFAIKIGLSPKSSKENKSIENKQVEHRRRISLLMFDVVVLARGGGSATTSQRCSGVLW